jgi:hypothetical protein
MAQTEVHTFWLSSGEESKVKVVRHGLQKQLGRITKAQFWL